MINARKRSISKTNEAGRNAAKVKKIVSAKELMDDIVNEAIRELDKI